MKGRSGLRVVALGLTASSYNSLPLQDNSAHDVLVATADGTLHRMTPSGVVLWSKHLSGGPLVTSFQAHSHSRYLGGEDNDDEEEEEEVAVAVKEEKKHSVDGFEEEAGHFNKRQRRRNPHRRKPHLNPWKESSFGMLPTVGWTVLSYGNGQIHAMDVTVPELVEQAPIQTKDGTLFMGSKTSLILGIDLKTGTMLDEDAYYHQYGNNNMQSAEGMLVDRKWNDDDERTETSGRDDEQFVWFVRQDHAVRGMDRRTRRETWNLTRGDLAPISSVEDDGRDDDEDTNKNSFMRHWQGVLPSIMVASADGVITMQCENTHDRSSSDDGTVGGSEGVCSGWEVRTPPSFEAPVVSAFSLVSTALPTSAECTTPPPGGRLQRRAASQTQNCFLAASASPYRGRREEQSVRVLPLVVEHTLRSPKCFSPHSQRDRRGRMNGPLSYFSSILGYSHKQYSAQVLLVEQDSFETSNRLCAGASSSLVGVLYAEDLLESSALDALSVLGSGSFGSDREGTPSFPIDSFTDVNETEIAGGHIIAPEESPRIASEEDNETKIASETAAEGPSSTSLSRYSSGKSLPRLPSQKLRNNLRIKASGLLRGHGHRSTRYHGSVSNMSSSTSISPSSTSSGTYFLREDGRNRAVYEQAVLLLLDAVRFDDGGGEEEEEKEEETTKKPSDKKYHRVASVDGSGSDLLSFARMGGSRLLRRREHSHPLRHHSGEECSPGATSFPECLIGVHLIILDRKVSSDGNASGQSARDYPSEDIIRDGKGSDSAIIFSEVLPERPIRTRLTPFDGGEIEGNPSACKTNTSGELQLSSSFSLPPAINLFVRPAAAISLLASLALLVLLIFIFQRLEMARKHFLAAPSPRSDSNDAPTVEGSHEKPVSLPPHLNQDIPLPALPLTQHQLQYQVERYSPHKPHIFSIGRLRVSTKDILGKGSMGTIVFRGVLGRQSVNMSSKLSSSQSELSASAQNTGERIRRRTLRRGRPVAVKRMLSEHSFAANREVELLTESDGHPNVVRYFFTEDGQSGDIFNTGSSPSQFVYLTLELCAMSLADAITQIANANRVQRFGCRILSNHLKHVTTADDAACGEDELDINEPWLSLPPPEVQNALLDIVRGVAFLHSNHIVHRDIKPQNILLSPREGWSQLGLTDTEFDSDSDSENADQNICSEENDVEKSESDFKNGDVVDKFNGKQEQIREKRADGSDQKGDPGSRVLSKVRSSLRRLSDLGHFTLKISDMGLGKQLSPEDALSSNAVGEGRAAEGERQQQSIGRQLPSSSFGHSAIGTAGWSAPEVIARRSAATKNSFLPSPSTDAYTSDMFSVGCVIFYVLSGGHHLYGDEDYERDNNIVRGYRAGLHRLMVRQSTFCNDSFLGPNLAVLSDARDVVCRLTNHHSTRRPPASALLPTQKLGVAFLQGKRTGVSRNNHTRSADASTATHPLFWQHEKRLEFLADLSDRLEREGCNISSSPLLEALENQSMLHPDSWKSAEVQQERQNQNDCDQEWVFGRGPGETWVEHLDIELLGDATRFRSYDISSVRDCLRVIRNKRHHWHDLPSAIRDKLLRTPVRKENRLEETEEGGKEGGEDVQYLPFPAGLGRYFDDRFPRLVLHCYRVAAAFLATEPAFATIYFGGSEGEASGSGIAWIDGTTAKAAAAAVSSLTAVVLDAQRANDCSDVIHQKSAIADSLDECRASGGCGCDITDRGQWGEGKGEGKGEGSCSKSISNAENRSNFDSVIWHGTETAKASGCRGWYRPTSHWRAALDRKGRLGLEGLPAKLQRATGDPKLRTRLCQHWENSFGAHCPFKKKRRGCDYAHGPFELRVKPERISRWGRVNDGPSISTNASGGEDTYGTAKKLQHQ